MTTKTLLDKIAEAPDIERENVEIPEWGVTIQVRTPSMIERSALVEAQIAERAQVDESDELDSIDMSRMQFQVIQACCFDPDSEEQLFTVANTERDMTMLHKKNGRVVWDLFRICQKLSGLTDDAEEEVDLGKDGSGDSP